MTSPKAVRETTATGPLSKGAARRQQRRRQPPRISREAKILLLLGIPVLFVVAAFAVLANSGGSQTGTPVAQQDVLVRADSPVLGAADARVIVVEFLDPECESCRAAHPGIKRLLAEYNGRVKLVVRYFPLHQNSVLAAAATEAAGEQGKYWEMQDMLFANQPQWGEKATPQAEVFVGYARTLGLNVEQFTAAMRNPKYAEKVERDRRDGVTVGVRGTPTLFVNGQQARAADYATLKTAIDAALR